MCRVSSLLLDMLTSSGYRPSVPAQSTIKPCLLALEDGSVFTGQSFGAQGTTTGEFVFNTAMTGYQEILTDPSYCGQVVVMTSPLIGNYGINDEDLESSGVFAHGFVVRELARRHSNHRATKSLARYLAEQGVVGISGIDTRALTRKLRLHGSMRGVLTTEESDPRRCVELALASESMQGADLVERVAPKQASDWTDGLSDEFNRSRPDDVSSKKRMRVAAIDCGMKRNILRHLIDLGCDVRIFPPRCSAKEILEGGYDGVFVSNGPGDPAAVHYVIDLLKQIMGKLPIFGICLGHQLLGLALGAKSFKLKFGHHGGNHPVQNLLTGRVEITSQNHGFAIDADSIEKAGAMVTHVNLNDKTLEGFVHKEMPVLAVQYHPEASPGPQDAAYLFDCFATMMKTGNSPNADQMSQAQEALKARLAHPQTSTVAV